ncbi:MAG: hypothetical protein JWM80_3387 [Cyanobacteria bacterium RYN_339]|nr:hypothetical protein [Cyanobacteria bacterium RYN_339]
MFKRLAEDFTALALWIRGAAMGHRAKPKPLAPSPPAGEVPVRAEGVQRPADSAANLTSSEEQSPELRSGPSAMKASPAAIKPDAPRTQAARDAAIAAAARQTPDPNEDLGTEAAPSRDAWITAMLAEHGMAGGTAATGALDPGNAPPAGGTGVIPGRGTQQLPGERIALIELRGTPDEATLRALRAFPMHQAVPGTPEYRELVHGCFDRTKLRLLQRLAEEDLFPYAVRQWKPGGAHRQNNLEIVYAVHARLGVLMGSLYDFDPAPLGTAVGMPATLHACYDEKRRELLLGVRHLVGGLPDLMDALAHQQAHCLQHQYIERAEVPEALQPVVAAWRQDFRQWGQTCRPLGIGYHAIDLGRSVGNLFLDLARREGI